MLLPVKKFKLVDKNKKYSMCFNLEKIEFKTEPDIW